MDVHAVERFCRPDRAAILSHDEAVFALHAFSPRCRFIKTLPLGASVLDVGAGDGSLQIYRSWPGPARADLKMYAWAADKGPGFDLYDGYEIGVWPDDPPRFGGRKFDAVIAANFIEHIDDPIDFVKWAVSVLEPHGSIYLEWPRPETTALPSCVQFAAIGLPIITGNYFDDGSHRRAIPDVGRVTATLAEAGLALRESGTACVPFVDQELAIHAASLGDAVGLTLAYWSFSGWCRYLVAETPFRDRSGA
jgi:SAM-dependent methyltransferase